MYIARDEEGTICLFSEKPVKWENPNNHLMLWDSPEGASEIFMDSDDSYSLVVLNDNAFPEVTFENSPIEVVLNLKNK